MTYTSSYNYEETNQWGSLTSVVHIPWMEDTHNQLFLVFFSAYLNDFMYINTYMYMCITMETPDSESCP